MKFRFHSSSILATLLLVVPLLPTYFAKISIPILYLFLVFDLFRSKFIFSSFRLFLFLCLMPSFFNLLLFDPVNIVRVFPFIYLLFSFSVPSPNSYILSTSRLVSGLIFFIFFSSIFLALGNPLFVSLRDTFYPMDETSFNYGVLDNFSLSFGSFRFGGLWKNPNVTSSIVFILTLVSYVLHIRISSRLTSLDKIFTTYLSKHYILLFFSLAYIYLSGNRTYLFSIFVFLVYPFIGPLFSIFLRPRIRIAVLLAFFTIAVSGLFVFLFGSERILQSLESSSSLGVKLLIISGYISDSDFLSYIFGSPSSMLIQFDTEFGSWFGIGGILSILSLLGMYTLYLLPINLASYRFQVLIPLFLCGLGNTLFFGNLTSALCIPLLLYLKFPNLSETKSFS